MVANSDYIVIATRPAHCLETLDSLEFKAGQVLISVVAGIEVDAVKSCAARAVRDRTRNAGQQRRGQRQPYPDLP